MNMARTWFILSVVWIFAGACWPVQAQPTRGSVVFVDYEAVFTNYFKTKLANEQLQGMYESINRERANLIMQFDALQAQLNELRTRALNEKLDEAARATIRRDVDLKLIELQRIEERSVAFNESQDKRWEEQNRRVRDDITGEIREKISAMMTTRGYLAVVDSSMVGKKGDPAILYFDPRSDITEEVIKEINP